MRINKILFWTFLSAAVVMTACKRNSDEPDTSSLDASSQYINEPVLLAGDYTENMALAASAPWPVVRVGLRVGDNVDSLMTLVMPGVKDCYLVLEYLDTLGSASYHYVPSCWADVPHGQPLADSVYAYTRRTLLRVLATSVATPPAAAIRYVQLGRCVSGGLLWHEESDQLLPARPMEGYELAWRNQSIYLKAASRAVREVCPGAKIVLHHDRVGETESIRKQMSNLLAYWSLLGIDYDVLALAFNPLKCEPALSALEYSLTDEEFRAWVNNVGVQLHLETFYPCRDLPSELTYLSETKVGYPYSYAGQKQYLEAVCALLKTCREQYALPVCGLIYRYCAPNPYFQLFDYNFLSE